MLLWVALAQGESRTSWHPGSRVGLLFPGLPGSAQHPSHLLGWVSTHQSLFVLWSLWMTRCVPLFLVLILTPSQGGRPPT